MIQFYSGMISAWEKYDLHKNFLLGKFIAEWNHF